MKKIIPILIILAMVVMVWPVALFADAPDYGNTAILDNKTGEPDWYCIQDNTLGQLDYNSTGQNFDYYFVATSLTPDTNYSLIYYADPYPGNNPGLLIGSGYSDDNGNITLTDSLFIGHNLPVAPDTNINGDYCTKDCNGHLCNPGVSVCSGAKIWLVPSSCYDAGTNSIISWQWQQFLFDTDLINYTYVADSQTVSLTTEIPEDMICVSVEPDSIDFGSIYRGQCKELMSVVTITNCGNIPIIVTAVTSGNLYGNGNLDISHGSGWNEIAQWSTDLNAGQSKVLHLKLCIPSDFPTGIAYGSLGFLAEAQ